jgi:uncharacterized membrane protein
MTPGADADATQSGRRQRAGESRWPMAIAILATGALRAVLPSQLRSGDGRWVFLGVLVVLLAVLVVADPGRIDRQARWLRGLTGALIGLITVVNASAALRLVAAIVSGKHFTDSPDVLLVSGGAIWVTNVIAFGLWYWDLDRGGAVARALGSSAQPSFLFPEMTNPEFVGGDWYPRFVDYLHFSFATATAFSPTDVSAIRPWAKLMMIAQEAISLVVALLVIARAVNIMN